MRSILGQSAGQIAAALSANVGAPALTTSIVYGSGVRQHIARRDYGWVPASINRNTGKPHEHRREIARRQRRGEA